MADLDALIREVTSMARMLDLRASNRAKLLRYYDSDAPMPASIVRARVTRAYRLLMPQAGAPWGALVVDSVQDRLEVSGIVDSDNPDAAKKCWDIWQRNRMDAEAKLAQNSALIDGRAFALVWPTTDKLGADGDAKATISIDASDQMIVRYREGSRYIREAALRRWTDDEDGCPHAILYHGDYLYKFKGPKNTSGRAGTQWMREDVPLAGGKPGEMEPWPLPNPLGEVPVFETRINPRLVPGRYPFARGEYEHCLGLIDRIHLLTFLGLVVAFWAGFPVRGIVGDRILRDDDDNPIPPFDVGADEMFQLENPEAKLASFPAADRKNLQVYAELDHLATITKTPRHYFPMEQAPSGLSADSIRADEGGLNAKVIDHKTTIGEGDEAMLQCAGRIEGVELSPNAAMAWADRESRSMAERADAAQKLKDVIPWAALAEKVLGASQDEIGRWESQRSSDALASLVAAAAMPANVPGTGQPPAPAAAGNGNGAGPA